MNIQNIVKLSDQLTELGFINMETVLAKRICFRPQSFSLPYRFEKGEFALQFQIFFEACGQPSHYALKLYDAALQKASPVQQMIAGIDVAKLSMQMSQIDWMTAFDFSERKASVSKDTTAFEKELAIESIVEQLFILDGLPEGRTVSMHLRTAHWAGSAYHEIFPAVGHQIFKPEVSQRFYVIEGEPGITVEEAIRYLQNRWLEKEMLAKRKQANSLEDEDNQATGFGTGLLKKRRRRKPAGSKSSK